MRVIIDIEQTYFELIQDIVQHGDSLKVHKIIAAGLVIPGDFLKNCDIKN